MWCHNCQQDVPAISAAGEIACCARCGRALDDEEIDGLAEMADQGIDLADDTCATADAVNDEQSSGDWMLDEEVSRLKRRLGNSSGGPWDDRRQTSGAAQMAADALAATLRSAAQPPDGEKRQPQASLIAWGILSIGLMSFVCGAVLLGWSLVTSRGDLWSLGMPATLAGQFGLLLGLALQLDHLWQANRRTADTLTDVDQRLREINHATTLLRTTHSAPAQSFYAHLAEGANPQLLLADLKGQLDLLAVKMSAQR
jgi:hypothetical protein